MVVVIFVMGVAIGHFFHPSSGSKVSYSINREPPPAKIVDINRDRLNKKLDLLRDYINFVNLPREQIGDTSTYVIRMGEEVQATNDAGIIEKYSATGDQNNQEKNILDFFNFLIESIKNDLK